MVTLVCVASAAVLFVVARRPRAQRDRRRSIGMYHCCRSIARVGIECHTSYSKCCECLGGNACHAPFGKYVLLSGAFNFPAVTCAAFSFVGPDVRECTAAPLPTLCGVDVALGLAHFGAACYLQRRLLAAISAAHGPAGWKGIAPKELKRQANGVIMFDHGFRLYICVFVGSFALQCVGFTWINACDPDSQLPWAATILLAMFGLVAVGFFCLWFMALECGACLDNLAEDVMCEAHAAEHALARAPMAGASWARQMGSYPGHAAEETEPLFRL
uniref:Protein S-acyltransferase n=1 Tax=Zooxanthella nutricula TaxID=1333877 RepID=A0A7S2MPP4_9DINO